MTQETNKNAPAAATGRGGANDQRAAGVFASHFTRNRHEAQSTADQERREPTPEDMKEREKDHPGETIGLALQLARRGWYVFPCKPDKRPHWNERDLPNGKDNATTDPEQIRTWWERWPNALVGVYCEKSGIFALDVDNKNGKNGSQTLADLVRDYGAGHDIPVGPVQSTPSGGLHLIFRYPEGRSIPNNSGKLGDGLDLRSNGYICTGPGYAWHPGHGPDSPLTDAPAWLLELIDSLGRPRTHSGDVGAYWLEKALGRAEPGNRNDTGLWLACQLRDSGLSSREAESYMLQYARSVKGDGYTAAEALASLQQAYKAPRREPARLPGYFSAPGGHEMADRAGRREETTWLPAERLARALASEYGDAELMAELYAGRILYDRNEKEWLWWNGVYWEAGAAGKVANLLPTELAAQYLRAAAEYRRKSEDEKAQALAQELAKRAQSLGQRKRAKNVLEWMADHPALSVAGGWDARPMLLPVENGVLNLETGELEPGRPEDMLRKHAPTRWAGLQASAPIFERVVSEIMGKDPVMVGLLRRLFGYCITGKVTEHIVPILYGEDGRNGKGTLLETIKDVLGDELASPIPAAVLVQANQEPNGEAPRPFLFGLRGKRLVWASETGEGQRLNSALLKLLSGGDTITARTLHGKPDTFKATHKIMLLTNGKPEVDALDSALWERLLLIPFEQRFVDNPSGPNEHPRDKDLPEKLRAEAPGILAWLVRGCLEWQAQGLQPPDKVRAATKELRDENDFYHLWAADGLVENPGASTRAGVLFAACEKWCTRNGHRYSRNTLGKWLKKHYKHERTNAGIIYYGVALRQEEGPQWSD